MSHDVIVIGLGAMGSATAYHLASRGARVLGIEAFTPAHELGSSGGLTRIIRLAYFEHPSYVPMLRAAWDLWPRIEAEADQGQLLQVTGGLYIGRAGSAVLDGAINSARTHALEHELLDAQLTNARFPAFQLTPDMAALHEPLAGLLYADRCIRAHIELARKAGAELQFEERVTGWSSAAGQVTATTTAGTYEADRLVVAAGPWLPQLMPELNLPLSVERNALFWFRPQDRPAIFGADALPVWIMELDADFAFYGFPSLPDQGLKVARHHGGQPVDPGRINRVATPADEVPVRDFLRRYMPLADGEQLDSRVCMYTNTPDFDFILDFYPGDERVVIASPCSGHGFKFSTIIGSIAADLALDGRTPFDIDFLSLGRFAHAA